MSAHDIPAQRRHCETHLTLVLGRNAGVLLADEALHAVTGSVAFLTILGVGLGIPFSSLEDLASQSLRRYTHITLVVLLALESKAGVLLAHQTPDTIAGLLAGLAQLRLRGLLKLVPAQVRVS